MTKQLKQITAIAVALPPEKRSLLRVASYCQLRGLFKPRDTEVEAALRSALTGLQHERV